ncbi:MAG: GreA/GreB family elongation factor [Nitrospira sp.]
MQEGVPVTIRIDDGIAQTVTVVPREDASPSLGFISSESPVGKALLGKRPGDQISIEVDGQLVDLLIEKIGAASDTISK